MSIESTTTTALELLKANKSEWEDRYDSYANTILRRLSGIENDHRLFHQWNHLYIYMSLINAMSNRNAFSIRFKGQKIGCINVTGETVTISTKGCTRPNSQYFNYDEHLDNTEWPSAIRFRRHFRDIWNIDHITHSDESQIESLFLTELEQTKRINKFFGSFWGMRPVKLANKCRFQMKTPFSAARNPLEYLNTKGGGIDVLARFGMGSRTTLSICELKTPKINETQPAIEQGLAYSIFIRELLRSKSGDNWYKIFGYKGKLPDALRLNCVVVMGDHCEPFVHHPITIGNDSIHFHYMFYKKTTIKDRQGLEIVKTSLPLQA